MTTIVRLLSRKIGHGSAFLNSTHSIIRGAVYAHKFDKSSAFFIGV